MRRGKKRMRVKEQLNFTCLMIGRETEIEKERRRRKTLRKPSVRAQEVGWGQAEDIRRLEEGWGREYRQQVKTVGAADRLDATGETGWGNDFSNVHDASLE